jgi:hypothetical protein
MADLGDLAGVFHEKLRWIKLYPSAKTIKGSKARFARRNTQYTKEKKQSN